MNQKNDNFIDKTFTILADLLLTLTPITSREKKAFSYYRDGMSAQSEGEYAEALQNYYQALRLEKDPYDRSYILYNIGLIYASNGEHLRALDYYYQALDRNFNLVQALNNIAVIAPRTDLGVKEVDSFLIALDKINKEPVYIGWYEENSAIDLRPNFKELRDIAWEIETRDEYQEFLGVEIDVLDSMFEVDNDEVYDMFR